MSWNLHHLHNVIQKKFCFSAPTTYSQYHTQQGLVDYIKGAHVPKPVKILPTLSDILLKIQLVIKKKQKNVQLHFYPVNTLYCKEIQSWSGLLLSN